jgi:phi13 family phage major tail protein
MKKVKFGLKNVHYAVVTETTDSTTGAVTSTYGTVKAWPGAVNISLDPSGDDAPFYADDGVYYVASSASSYEADFESASVPNSFKKDIFGDIEDANGAIIEVKSAVTKYFAFGFETSGDVGGQRTVFYKCSASRPEASSATIEDGTEVQTQTVTIKAIGRADDFTLGNETVNLIQATLTKGQTGYDTFFESVYVPTP